MVFGVRHPTVAFNSKPATIRLSPGIYHNAALSKQLGIVRAGLFSEWLKRTVFYQPEFGESAAVLVLVSNVGRLIAKYGSRGYRFGLICFQPSCWLLQQKPHGLNVRLP